MILHMIKTQSVQSDPKQGPIVESCILTCTRMNSRRPAVEFVNSSPGWFHASVCLGATRENLYWQSAVLTWAPPSQIGCMSDEYGSSVPVWASFWEFVLMNSVVISSSSNKVPYLIPSMDLLGLSHLALLNLDDIWGNGSEILLAFQNCEMANVKVVFSFWRYQTFVFVVIPSFIDELSKD